MYSYAKADSDSVMEDSIPYNNSLPNADTMSYAYSLEPGLESVAGGYAGESVHSRNIPREVPSVGVPQRNPAKGRYETEHMPIGTTLKSMARYQILS